MTPPIPTKPTCPRCQTPLPSDAVEGLCVACLAEAFTPGDDPTDPDGLVGAVAAELGETLPEFEIEGFLGRGGMGLVYRARQASLGRRVALKVLLPELCDDGDLESRFSREAKTLARISHPNIVGIHDYGRAGSLYWLAMEYVEGTTLRDLIDQGRLAPAEVLRLVPQVCDALQAAHDAGIVHRDIKPANILVDDQGTAKIADFGIAKLIHRGDGDALSHLTATHDRVGTLRYMAPEQANGAAQVDHRADIFSLGVVLYELLTGRTPTGAFEAPSKLVGVDDRLDGIVHKALQHNPALRYQQASIVRSELERVEKERPSRKAPARWRWNSRSSLTRAVVVAAVVAAVGIAIAARPKDAQVQREYWKAVYDGDLDAFRELAENGAWLHPGLGNELRQSNGDRPIHIAVDRGYTKFALYLIERKVELDQRRASDGAAPLHIALFGGRNQIALALIKAGADTSLRSGSGLDPLVMACSTGLTEVAAALIEAGAAVSSGSGKIKQTPLCEAASRGHSDIVRLLIARGVDVTSQNTLGNTALHLAAAKGHLGIVRQLLGESAPLETVGEGGATPLHFAAQHGHEACVVALIAAGARIEPRDESGRTPLMHAARNGLTEVMRVLVGRGADPEATDADGLTLSDYASVAAKQATWSYVAELGVPESPIGLVIKAFVAAKRGEWSRVPGLLADMDEIAEERWAASRRFNLDGYEYGLFSARAMGKLLLAEEARRRKDLAACKTYLDAARSLMGKEGRLYRKFATTTRTEGDTTITDHFDRTFFLDPAKTRVLTGVYEGRQFELTSNGSQSHRREGPGGSDTRSSSGPATVTGLVH